MTKFIRNSASLVVMALCSVLILSSCQKENLQIPEMTSNASTMQKGTMTIGEIAAANGNFTQLVEALEYTGLLNLFLTGTDQYTVFAPTDDAFEALYTALNINSIRDLDVNLVTNVLLYHVTEGRRFSNSVLPKNNVRSIETLLNKNFYVNSTGGIDTNDADTNSNAMISTADISAKNGVIHVINSVLIPQ